MTQDIHFSLLTHTKQLLLVTFHHIIVGIEVSFWTDIQTDGLMDRRKTGDGGRMDGQTVDGQTDVEVNIE